MTTLSEGGCLCGAIRYTITGAPAMAMVCHCTHCQKQSGSAFSTIIGINAADIAIRGTPASYADTGDSGGAVTRQFCGTCGSPLFSLIGARPDMIFVKSGTLDDPSGFAPAVHIWGKSKQPWVETGDVPVFDIMPG